MFKFENLSQLRSYNSFMNLAEYLSDSTSFDAETIILGFYKLFLYSEYIYYADFNTLTVNEKMLKSVYDEVGLYDRLGVSIFLSLLAVIVHLTV